MPQKRGPTRKASAPVESTRGNGAFPVVGIGASAGGFEAFKQLLSQLPEKTGMAFLLVQHLDPRRESRLPELLARVTPLAVVQAVHGMSIRPDHVYLIPPDSNMAVSNGKLQVTGRTQERGPHLSIDHLFRSLAQDQQARAIGVVLSGTGSDGTLGLAEIKAVGGITFAQDEGSAAHTGMPRSAIDSGSVDFVLPPEEIAVRVTKIGSHPYLAPAEKEEAGPPVPEDQFKKVLISVHRTTGVDFSLYRDTTIRRRIMRRMALHSHGELSEYVGLLEQDRSEVEALYRDLLINVTSFFRDPAMFDALKKEVFPEILKKKGHTEPWRLWVPGCSTGQEAYSLAITLLEFFGDHAARPPIQIFATDLSDPPSLDRARAGIYPETIEADVSPERLRRFFRREDHIYRIDKTIREMCVFARQNLIADPPFSRMDLISCRNVLIYMAPELQKRIIPMFHYALNVPGFLVLGSAETIGEFSDLFDVVDRSCKLYVKKATPSRPGLHFTLDTQRLLTGAVRPVERASASPTDFQREADRLLLGRFAPPAVLVNDKFDILQFRGRTSRYLEHPQGEPTANVLRMARDGLFLELRSALNEAIHTGTPVRREQIRIRDEYGTPHDVNFEVLPVKPAGGGSCFLILFEEAGSTALHPALYGDKTPSKTPQRELTPAELVSNEREIVQLRHELSATKDYLQSLVEQQDAANEELRSANEEILSSNEELQSTNEELETAKEELQSANEELTTVNEQLQQRNFELARATDDLTNLLSSTNIPLVMVGSDLCVRRITPAATKVMRLVPGDVGRPVSDIKMNVEVAGLDSVIAGVIDTVQMFERDVCDRDGRWHLLRVYPYRTADNKIDGAVVILVDVDQIKQQAHELAESDRLKDEFLAMLAHELRNPLTPITNAVELMRIAAGDPAEMKRIHEMLRRQLGLLTHIVDDLLDVSRVAKDKINLRKRVIDVSEVLNAAVEMTRPYIDARGVELALTPPSERIHLDADPVRLTQVLANLLNNAAKFSNKGGRIWVAAAVEPTSPPLTKGGPRGVCSIRVRDNGAGIAPELLPKIFDLFVQGGQPLDRGAGGLGVGLSLVKKLVTLHEGTVEAHSAGPGKGSEFIVRLPTTDKRPEPEAGRAPAAASDRKRVLVVDDNHDAAQSTADLIKLAGHEVCIAHDGPGALEAAKEFHPDVAFLDIGLPGMNGYEVARKFRELPSLEKLHLAALSGYGQEEDRRKSAEAGFDEHFTKPIDAHALHQFVATEWKRD